MSSPTEVPKIQAVLAALGIDPGKWVAAEQSAEDLAEVVRVAVEGSAARARNQEHQRLKEALEYMEGQLRPGVAIGKVPQANVARAYRRVEAELDALDTFHPSGEPVSFTCCNLDKLSPESKAAVEQVVQAAAGKLADDSPLTAEERAEYEAARRSIVEARNALPPSGEQGEESEPVLPPQRNAKGGLTTFGLYVNSLRWAVGYIDKLKPKRFRSDEWPPSGIDDDWMEWAAAHDLLKDASAAPATDPSKEVGS